MPFPPRHLQWPRCKGWRRSCGSAGSCPSPAASLLAEPSPALPANPPWVSPSLFCCSDSSLLGGGAAGLPNLAILGLFLKAPAVETVGRAEAHRLPGGFGFFKERQILLPVQNKPGTGAHGVQEPAAQAGSSGQARNHAGLHSGTRRAVRAEPPAPRVGQPRAPRDAGRQHIPRL